MLSNWLSNRIKCLLSKNEPAKINPNNNTNLHTNYIVDEIAALVKAKLKNDEDNCFCGFGDGDDGEYAGSISLFMIAVQQRQILS